MKNINIDIINQINIDIIIYIIFKLPIFIPNRSFASSGMNVNIEISLNISTGLKNKIIFKKSLDSIP